LDDQHDQGQRITVLAGEGVTYTVPQYFMAAHFEKKNQIMFRVSKVSKDMDVKILDADDKLIRKIRRPYLAPGEMEKIMISEDDLKNSKGQITIKVESQNGT
ncbi:MAG TPA: hypothetical protein VLM88_03050, partial [Proteiniclasticum sp.]|nr:hypothetical protein [Proteiniclasticum sp.]